jgi:ABC-2 type transport system permease protein
MRTKFLAVAWKDIYTTYKDRNAILMMFAMPLVLSTIIGLVFGSGGDVKLDTIQVGVVNQDSGVDVRGQMLSLGQYYQEAFVAPPTVTADNPYQAIYQLTYGRSYPDVQAARKKVEDGDLAAAILIPPDFTQQAFSGSAAGTVQIYYDSARSIGPSVVASIVRAITNGMNTSILVDRVGPAYLAQLAQDLGREQDTEQAVQHLDEQRGVLATAQPIRLEQVDLAGKTRSFDALQYFAPSMAILFMTFTMASGATSILVEQRDWTLQRIITTPTPRWIFMGGKLLGTFLSGLVQMIVLMLATTLVARLMGRTTSVWGTNYAGLVLLLLAVVFAATSLGLLIAALAKTPAQASTYSTVALFLLGMLGGSFIPIEGLPKILAWMPKITLNYWGIQGFTDLSYGQSSVGGIGTSLLALSVMGVVLFGISLWRFNRRLDV